MRHPFLLLLFVLVPAPGHGSETILTNQRNPAEFADYVNYYAALQRVAVAALGPPLMWSDAELLLRQQRRFANAMREARPIARAGDIFTPAVAKYRFLGRHLMIIDVLAGLVVDVLYETLPEPEFSSS